MWTSLHSGTMQDRAVKPCSVKCGMGGAEGCHNTGELTHLGERDSYPYKRGLDRKVGAPSCDKVPLLSQHPFVANFLPFPTNWHPLSHLSEYNLVQLCGDIPFKQFRILVILEHIYAGAGGRGGHTSCPIPFLIFLILSIFLWILNSGDPWTYICCWRWRHKLSNIMQIQQRTQSPNAKMHPASHTNTLFLLFVESIYVCLSLFSSWLSFAIVLAPRVKKLESYCLSNWGGFAFLYLYLLCISGNGTTL